MIANKDTLNKQQHAVNCRPCIYVQPVTQQKMATIPEWLVVS
jgi:hypothetical protein